jgi:hypothetical protein
METKIVICTLVLMFSAFAGSVFGGTEGPSNTYYGSSAGNLNETYYNTFIGNSAGYNNTGTLNTYVGWEAGMYNTTGGANTFMGTLAGAENFTGVANTSVGFGAGEYNTGSYNTFIGHLAGYVFGRSSGSGNVFLGSSAGECTTGSGNVFLGYMAGRYDYTGSNKLYIANSSTATPLIYGEFDNSIVGINGYLGVGTQAPVRAVHLSGSNAVFRMDRIGDTVSATSAFQMVRQASNSDIWKVYVVGVNATGTNTGEFVIWDNGTNLSGAYNRRMTIANDGTVTFPGDVYMHAHYNTSSITLKDNVRTYGNALDTVNRLRGVSFDWKDSGKPAVGLIAEEVAKVVPEVVAYNDGAATGVNYASLVGVLVEAVKEQEMKLEKQQAQHQAEMDRMNVKIAELERLLTSK